MDQRHREYVDYYRARLRKYEGNPLYPHSEAAERALYEAISTAASLEEFRQRMQQNRYELACAVARVRDQATARANLYLELGEEVRAQPELEILRLLDSRRFDDVAVLVTTVNEIEAKWRLEISRDETLVDELWNDFGILEDIEEYEYGEVPERWHHERRQGAARELEQGARNYHEHALPEIRKFLPDYQPDYQALWQVRHRRKIPLADPVVERRIQNHKRYRGIR